MTAFQPNPEKLTPYEELGGGLDTAYQVYLSEISTKQVVRVPTPRRHSGRVTLEQGDSGLDRHWSVTQDSMSPEEKIKRRKNARRGNQLRAEIFARIMQNKADSRAELDQLQSHNLTADEISQEANESWDEIERAIGTE